VPRDVPRANLALLNASSKDYFKRRLHIRYFALGLIPFGMRIASPARTCLPSQGATSPAQAPPLAAQKGGGVRGAIAGAASRAIAGDVGKGGADGRGRGQYERRHATERVGRGREAAGQAAANTAAQLQQQEAQANAAHTQSLDAFKASFSGYTVARSGSVK
jgi:hypothetical protein